MRRIATRIGLVVLAAFPMACGPAQPAEAPIAPAAVAAPTPKPAVVVAAAPAEAPLDLSPVAEPVDVIGIARWRSPAATFATGGAAAGVSPAVMTASSQMGVEELLKETLRGMVSAHDLAPLIALEAPVDAMAALDQNPQKRDAVGAFSVGLSSLDGARRAAELAAPLEQLAPGMWKIAAKKRGTATCVIAASAGSTPARLVCGPRDKDVLALAPYLTRTMPTVSSAGADLHAELRFSPVEARYGGLMRQLLSQAPLLAQSQISIDEPKFDRTVVEAATALSDEASDLASDLDKLTFDLELSPSAGLTTAGELTLRGRKSWIAQAITDRPERSGPPPALFWRLPRDSESAFFARGTDPARYTAMLRTLRTLLDGALTKFGVGTAADRKALADLIAMPLGKDTSSVQATGHVAAVALGPKATPQQRADALADSFVGWSLVGIDESPAAVMKVLKDVVAAYNRKSLLAPVRKAMGDDAKLLPTVKTVAAPAGLKGATDFEIRIAGLPAENILGDDTAAKIKVSLALHVLVLPDGGATWIAAGTNRDELVRRLNGVKSGAAEGGTLARRGGLEALRSGSNMTGGFMTLASVTSSLPNMMTAAKTSKDRDAKKVADAIARLPNHGETPILVTNTVSVAAKSRTSVKINVPRESMQDVISFIMDIAKGS